MNIKSLLFGSVAAMFAISGANAANTVVAEPEPVEFVRVCDAYGAGYFYIPGTDTCMRLSGYALAHVVGGDDVYARRIGDRTRTSYDWRTRIAVNFSTNSETELGTLRTFAQIRGTWDAGSTYGPGTDKTELRYAYLDLGGLHVGMDDSIFSHWTGYFGAVLDDDVGNNLAYERTNVISYTYNAGNGFSAIVGLEQGNDNLYSPTTGSFVINSQGEEVARELHGQIQDYTPHILLGVKYAQGWGQLSAVTAYNSYYHDWAAKVRVDLNVTDQFSVWAMAGYKSAEDVYGKDNTFGTDGTATKTVNNRQVTGLYRQFNSIYGDWGGDWMGWAGSTYQFNPKTSFNTQVSYDQNKTFAASANVVYELVPGLTLTPEVTYVSWDDNYGYASDTIEYVTSLKGESAVQGYLELKRSF